MSAQNTFPGGATTAVSFTFDVDAEAGWLGEGEEYARRLTILSEGRYGVVRGVPRILELLRRYDIPATFFVPGYTAQVHPGLVETLLQDGRGRPPRLSTSAQRQGQCRAAGRGDSPRPGRARRPARLARSATAPPRGN